MFSVFHPCRLRCTSRSTFELFQTIHACKSAARSTLSVYAPVGALRAPRLNYFWQFTPVRALRALQSTRSAYAPAGALRAPRWNYFRPFTPVRALRALQFRCTRQLQPLRACGGASRLWLPKPAFAPFYPPCKHGKKRSIAGTAQHSIPISIKESPLYKKFP